MTNIVSRWLNRDEPDLEPFDFKIPDPVRPGDLIPTNGPPPVAIPVAIIPRPYQEAPNSAEVIAKASALWAEAQQEKLDKQRRIEDLEAELAQSKQDHEAEKRKVAMLELESMEHLTTIATLQADNNDKSACMSALRTVLDRFGTKATPKKVRTPKPKKELAPCDDTLTVSETPSPTPLTSSEPSPT